MADHSPSVLPCRAIRVFLEGALPAALDLLHTVSEGPDQVIFELDRTAA